MTPGSCSCPRSPSGTNHPSPLKLALSGTSNIYHELQWFPVNHFLVRADLNSTARFTGMDTEMWDWSCREPSGRNTSDREQSHSGCCASSLPGTDLHTTRKRRNEDKLASFNVKNNFLKFFVVFFVVVHSWPKVKVKQSLAVDSKGAFFPEKNIIANYRSVFYSFY